MSKNSCRENTQYRKGLLPPIHNKPQNPRPNYVIQKKEILDL